MSGIPTSHDLTRRHVLGRSAALLAAMAAGGGVVSVARTARAVLYANHDGLRKIASIQVGSVF